MNKVTTSELIKLMSDEKVNKILLATQEKTGLNSKEIAVSTGIPKSQLYYTLNKMVDAELLEIVKEAKIRNLVEYYYSSYTFSQFDSQLSENLNNDIGGLSNISTRWAKKHIKKLIQWVVHRDQQFINQLDEELSSNKSSKDTDSQPSFYNTEINLSIEDEEKLWQEIIKLISKTETKNTSSKKRKVNLFIKKW